MTTEPLFDLYSVPATTSVETHGTFMLRARLSTIIAFCDSIDALRRVRAELNSGKEVALLYHNGRGRWAGTVHAIRPALAPLGTEV